MEPDRYDRAGPAASARIDLAHEPPLRLGPLAIEPSLCRVAHDDGREDVLQPRIMQVLVALLRTPGQVLSRPELTELCWDGVIVGEDAITRVMGRLRRLSQELGAEVFDVETIARIGYRIRLSTHVRPVPEDPGSAASRAPAAMPEDRRPHAGYGEPAPRDDAAPLLAVLAFDNRSSDEDLVYFSDGVSEEILTTVAQTTGIRVIGRSSSFQLRGPDKKPSTVAERLNATHVLDGSVRRSGDRVRTTVELVDCARQTTLWTERFDRQLADVFALQDEVAAAVARALESVFAPRSVAPVDPQAHDLYLRSRRLGPTLLPDVALLEAAVARAPDYLAAWESLALTSAMLAGYGLGPSFRELVGRAEAALSRVRALDPRSTIPAKVHAYTNPLCGAFQETERELAAALQRGPRDSLLLQTAGGAAYTVGRTRVALDYMAEALQLDPLSPTVAGVYGELLAANRRPRAALAFFDETMVAHSDNGFVRLVAIGVAIDAQDWERMDRYAALPGHGGILQPVVDEFIRHGRAARTDLAALARQGLEAQEAALAATGMVRLSGLGHICRAGLADAVFDLVARASFAPLFQPGGRLVLGDLSISHVFSAGASALRSDPRFPRLCAKLGLCDYWVNSGRWPDCADDVGYDFRGEATALTIRA